MDHTPEVQEKDLGRDAFTTALLNRAANVLGVKYVSGRPVDTVGVSGNEIGKVKTEIRSREGVFGVNDAGLIPLFIKAGDLATSRDASLRYYQQAYDVLEANHSGAQHSTVQGDRCIAGYAELGTRFFNHDHYDRAETIFAAAASLSRARAKRQPAAALFAPNASRQLQGVLRSWRDGAQEEQADVLPGSVNHQTDVPRRDGASQTEPLDALGVRIASRPLPSAAAALPAPAVHGLRSAHDLEQLVAYVFDDENVRESIETMLLARERYPKPAVAPGSLVSPLTELRESIDHEGVEVGRMPSSDVARKLL